MKPHSRYSVAFVILLLVTLLFSACGAERPANSVNLKCKTGETAVYFEVGVTPDSVVFWYQNDLKAYISEVSLPRQIEDVNHARSEMFFADVNFDGYEDFIIPYTKDRENEYSFVLLNNGDNTFVLYEALSDKPNISVSGQNVVSAEHIGEYGVRNFVYSIDQNGNLKLQNSYIEDATSVIRAVVGAYYGKTGYRVEHPLRNTPLGIRYGRNKVGDSLCTAYTVSKNGYMVAVIAIDDKGEWYIDEGGICLYKKLNISYDGVVTEGENLVSSGVPYCRMSVYDFESLSVEEQEQVISAMVRFMNDNGEQVVFNGFDSAFAQSVYTSDGSANLFEILCNYFGIDDGVFLDW
jgi:hypothetical protein